MSISTRHLRLAKSLGLLRNSQIWLHSRRCSTVLLPRSSTVSSSHDTRLKIYEPNQRRSAHNSADASSLRETSKTSASGAKQESRLLSEDEEVALPETSPIEEQKPVPNFMKLLGHKPLGSVLGYSRDKAIRARFAPSPTGDLHLGSLRTALFNKLAANATEGGKFILRIEDTDQNRLVPGAEDRLMEDLEWAGLSWDEGPNCGGPYGPYRQSARLEIYQEHIKKLIDSGHAYRCFCSPELLQAQKEQLAAEGQPTVYPQTCRHVSTEESEARAAAGERHSVRFKSNGEEPPSFRDAVYGLFKKRDRDEDFVLMKSDGYPTYHFANVVDDHLMKITHVIRGEEWLISTPKHIALYRAFGWEPPTFAHIGLLVNPDGSKLSKRDNNVNLQKYKEDHTLPLAFLRWLGNLGGSFHERIVPRTFDELTQDFTFRFTKGGIQLNLEKRDTIQQRYAAALILHPKPQYAEQEEPLIESHLVQPMLQHILRLTHNHDPTLHPDSPLHIPEYAPRPLELVPTLAAGSDDAARSKYLRSILNGGAKRGYEVAGNLINSNPYYFWRPPLALYRSSLAEQTLDDRVLAALEKIVNDPAPWDETTVIEERVKWAKKKDGPNHIKDWDNYPPPPELTITDQLSNALGDAVRPAHIKASVYHASVRVVITGSFTHHSQNSARMLAVLGRDELALRLGIVRNIIREQDAAGARPPLFKLRESEMKNKKNEAKKKAAAASAKE